MIDLVTYEFKDLNTGKIIPEESFVNSYLDKVYESEQYHNYNKRLHTILNAKHENSDLNKVMNN